MADEVAVQGMTLSNVEGAPKAVVGIITIIGTPSVINKVEGNGVYLDQLQIQVATITSPAGGATIADPGPVIGYINATINYVKEEGTKLLVLGDKTGTLSATPKIPGSPPTDYPVTWKVEITSAGQNKVRAK